METITEAAAEHVAHSKVRIIGQPEYEGVDFSHFPCEPDHADKYETSLMMALYPKLVQMDKYRPELPIPYEYAYRPNPWGFRSPTGLWRFNRDLDTTASPELGQRLIAAIVAHLRGRIEEEMARL